MAQKAEIQYVREFYVFGSEAPQPKPKTEKAKPKRPKVHLERLQTIYIDPLAVCGMVMAVVMLTLLVVGAFHLRDTRAEYDRVKTQLTEIKRKNATLEHTYHTSYDLEEIRQQAEKMGMVDAEEADRFTAIFTVPKEEKKPTAWDDFVWLLSGLFSEPKRDSVS